VVDIAVNLEGLSTGGVRELTGGVVKLTGGVVELPGGVVELFVDVILVSLVAELLERIC